jgi:ABC-type uncharacterized transport system YnjBCD ATPase subunit
MAILGPSGTFVTQILFISTLLKRSPGAGKTTLVEILAGKNKSGYTAGQVSFPATSSDAVTSPRVGFVPQRDILPPMLTVFEALLFAARLRLPETVSDSDKHTRVHAVMEKLGIEDISNVRIGWAEGSGRRGISGGEMRRVSIGLELVARPDVLILDEPTSGPSFILLCHIFIYLILIGVCRLGLGLGGKSGQCPSRSCSRSRKPYRRHRFNPSTKACLTISSWIIFTHGFTVPSCTRLLTQSFCFPTGTLCIADQVLLHPWNTSPTATQVFQRISKDITSPITCWRSRAMPQWRYTKHLRL